MLLAAAGSLTAKYNALQVARVITDNSYQYAETFLFLNVVSPFIKNQLSVQMATRLRQASLAQHCLKLFVGFQSTAVSEQSPPLGLLCSMWKQTRNKTTKTLKDFYDFCVLRVLLSPPEHPAHLRRKWLCEVGATLTPVLKIRILGCSG